MSIKEKLSEIQQEMKAPKNLKNTFGGYNYRNLESILEAFKPYESKHKVFLKLSDNIVEKGMRIYIEATAEIYDIETDESISVKAYAREAESKKGMDDSQITGTASSYARKYALNGLFLLDDTKDADTDEYQKEQRKDKASQAQINTILDICRKHRIDPDILWAKNNLDPKYITAIQAGQILQSFKKKYGDD